ncbi:MAG TPA: chemotaxis protein CheB [Sphingomicrobium sp.]|nr:chemotaxis protein CheB [Sphingomicrobium sp.]
MASRDIIVIGGSSGSRSVLNHILSGLPRELPASLFVTTHVPARSPPFLAEALSKSSSLPVVHATDGQPIERGCVYVAVPDHHLLIIDGTMRLGDGPRENMARPAIDPLFRSAALSYGSRAVGVILSGYLNDGASGLSAIKACGGTAVVQQPLDAEADQMPLAALEIVSADQVAPAVELARVLTEIVGLDAPGAQSPPGNLLLEVEIAAGHRLGSAELRQIAEPAPITCPDCQGVMSEVRGEQPLRYRCQIGHASTAEVLEARTREVDKAMQVALRIMEERLTLVHRMALDARNTGRKTIAELYEARVEEFSRYASVLRDAASTSVRNRAPAVQDDE